MKKLLLSILLLLLTRHFASAQMPARDFSLTVTDNAGGSQTLRFGLDPAGADGIDPDLGESELPPFPPTGVFEARFVGEDISIPQLGQGTYKDYRGGAANFRGTKTHELRYQPGAGSAITISWDLPDGVTGSLQDLLGGVVVNQSMKGKGAYIVQNPNGISKLKMTITYAEPTMVVQIKNSAIATYTLGQNFPNPFGRGSLSPSTTIEFSLPIASEVSLTILNTLGQTLQTLVRDHLPPGTYRIHWQANALPSGTYFYRLQAGRFAQTRSLVLLKRL